MLDWLFVTFGFLSSNPGILFTGALTAVIILLWDWRVALIGLCVIQLSAATAAVVLHNVPAEWAFTQTMVIVLVCLMLGLSARANQLRPAPRQTETVVSRGLLLSMFLVGAWFMDIQVTLPGLDPLVTELFVWLVLCGIMLLGLSDHPLYNGVGLLLWFIPVQIVVAILVPIPVIVAFVGLLVLLVGLAISYLLLIEHLPSDEGALILTDQAFPQQVRLGPAAPLSGGAVPPAHVPSPGAQLNEWIGRTLPRPRRPGSRRRAPAAPAVAPPLRETTLRETTQRETAPGETTLRENTPETGLPERAQAATAPPDAPLPTPADTARQNAGTQSSPPAPHDEGQP